MILLALPSGLCSVESRPIRAHLGNRPGTDGGFQVNKTTAPVPPSFPALLALLPVSIARRLPNLPVSPPPLTFPYFHTFSSTVSLASSPSLRICPPQPIQKWPQLLARVTYKNHHRKISLRESTATRRYEHGKTHTHKIIIERYGHWLWAYFYIQ